MQFPSRVKPEASLDPDEYQDWSEEDEDGEATQDDFVSSYWLPLIGKLLLPYLKAENYLMSA